MPLSAADLFLVFSYLITLESMHHTCQLPKEEELVQASIYFRQEQTLWTILDLEPPLSLEVKFHFPKAKPRNCSFGSCEAPVAFYHAPNQQPSPGTNIPKPQLPAKNCKLQIPISLPQGRRLSESRRSSEPAGAPATDITQCVLQPRHLTIVGMTVLLATVDFCSRYALIAC